MFPVAATTRRSATTLHRTLIAVWSGGSRQGSLQLNTALEERYSAPFGCRGFAFITGHKKTSKVNKKKQAAKKAKRLRKKGKDKHGMPLKSRQQQLREPKPSPPTPPDYPLGKESIKQKQKDVNIPPAVLTATASPYVFVSTAACVKAKLDPKQLFAHMFQMQDFHSGGNFRYFSPQIFKHDFPKASTPEVAFIGRSNVGKSSLVNALMRQKLALTSKQPGRTQQAYYYGWVPSEVQARKRKNDPLIAADAAAYLVDLPGYGYAVGPDKAVSNWQKSSQEYLMARYESGQLKRVYVLEDARLGVPQPIDQYVCDWLQEAGIPYNVVLTKMDDEKALAVKHANLLCLRYQLQSLEKEYNFMSPTIHVTSAKKDNGIVELLSSVATEFEEDPDEATEDGAELLDGDEETGGADEYATDDEDVESEENEEESDQEDTLHEGGFPPSGTNDR